MKRIVPSTGEWQALFNLMTRREKGAFLFLFLVAWFIGVFILMKVDREYSREVPTTGGSLREGILGIPSKINPLLAITDADRDLSRLIFAGLLKPDGKGGFVPELAERYEISEDGLTYTFFLRDDLYWHDKERVTADDVHFTVILAKNPKILSPRRANWEGVTSEVVGEREIKFYLRKAYSPFLENTTLGILPKHIWEKIPVEELTISPYNTEPIGAGPFAFESLTKNNSGGIAAYTLKRFDRYKPEPAYLNKLYFKFYTAENELKKDFENNLLDLASIPLNRVGAESRSIQLPRIIGVFFNQDNFKPLQDAPLREALALAIDRDRIVRDAMHGQAVPTSLPLPPGTFGYAPQLEHLEHNVDRARELLLQAGYEDTDGDGVIEKVSKQEKIPIRFTIATSNIPELTASGTLIRDMWKEIGIEVNIQPYEIGDLEQSIIRPRNYSALLFGQVVAGDPFAFWHASQRSDLGLNVALYANPTVNKILEDTRANTDEEKRRELYRQFQEEITKDKPGVILYSPLYTYTIPSNLEGVELTHIPLPQDRFSTVEKWYLETRRVWNILARYTTGTPFAHACCL